MKIYKLSPTGYKLSHSINHEDTPAWRVIHWLAKNHIASKDKILSNVSGATSGTLAKLSMTRPPIIIDESGVEEDEFFKA